VLEIVSGDYRLVARLEEDEAPATVAAFRRLLPLESRIIHARWSGESCWIPFGPGGVSETEILFPYGPTAFASKAGMLAGNHFATIVEGGERLGELGRTVLWEGAQPIRFEER
jgi:hypothetical protein